MEANIQCVLFAIFTVHIKLPIKSKHWITKVDCTWSKSSMDVIIMSSSKIYETHKIADKKQVSYIEG